MANPITKFFKRSGKLRVIALESNDTCGVETSGSRPEPVTVSNPNMALTLSTVYRCVTLLSESVASLPLRHERRINGGWQPVDDALTEMLSVAPNRWTSAFDFWKQAVQTRLLWGSAYIVPRLDMFDNVRSLVLARPGTANPSSDLDEFLFNDIAQGLTGRYYEREIVRLKGMTLDGVTCLSVIGYAASTASISATADRNLLQNYASGGATKGILTNESGVQGVGEYQTAQLQAAADRLGDAVRNYDQFAALGGVWKFIPLTMSAADMQFLQSRQFGVRELCRFFGVHPSFVFDDTSNNYKSAEMANVAFLANTLNPILRQIENELDRKLNLPAGERIRFDRTELYATDLQGRMAYIEKRIQTGTMTPNEARIAAGMQPAEGGDILLVSANLKPITELTDNGNNGENKD